MSAVSNSSPLILLSKINRFYLLKEIFKKIYIPKAVYEEICIKGKEKPGSKETLEGIKEGWIEIKDVKALPELELILGRGEAEAITLAKELSLPLIIDERKGRKIAEKIGIKVIGTLGVIIKAYKLGLIKNLEEEIDKFQP